MHSVRRVGIGRSVRFRLFSSVPSVGVGSSLIPMVNSLQSVFAQAKQDFDLPQIVVVGSQSSGKTSVIESLVGRGDFLPRGRGIVTRVPLILQLVQSEETYGEFVHDSRFSGKRMSDFARIKSTILEETDRIAGRGKGVSKHPIVLRLHSESAVPLTLVDTPGLTRVAVSGQGENVGLEIEDMVSGYISNPNSVILSVSPANVDLATSESLRLAKIHDPAGERTLGVLTKLDLMDRGTNALDVLSGRVYPLRLGFVGVVCRSQQDIDSGKSLQQSLVDEQKWFANSPVYASVASLNGVQYLSTRCNRLLVAHIKRVLPQLKRSIKHQARDLKKELKRIGDESAPQDAVQRGYLFLKLIDEFVSSFKAAIEGTDYAHSDAHVLNGGARIRHIFNEVFGKTLERISPLDGLSDRDIVAAIRNAAGPKPSIFLPEKAFDTLVKKSIKRLETPCIDCVDRVHSELLKLMLEMDRTNGVQQFPLLTDKILESGQKMLSKTKAPTVAIIKEIVAAEVAYINTNHKDFVGLEMLRDPSKYRFDKAEGESSSSHARQPEPENRSGFFSSIFGGGGSKSETPPPQAAASEINLQSATDRERFQVSLLKTLLSSYHGVVRKSLQDLTVKLVWKNVVLEATSHLQSSLMSDLYKPDLFESLLRENPQILSERIVLKERLKALREAKQVIALAEIREE